MLRDFREVSWRKPCSKSSRKSLIKVHLSVMALDVFGLRFKNMLVKNRLFKGNLYIKGNQALIKCLKNFKAVCANYFVYLGSYFILIIVTL